MTWTSKPRDYTEQAVDALRRAEEAITGQLRQDEAQVLRELIERARLALQALSDRVDAASA